MDRRVILMVEAGLYIGIEIGALLRQSVYTSHVLLAYQIFLTVAQMRVVLKWLQYGSLTYDSC